MGVSETPVLNPNLVSSALKRRVFAHSRSMQLRLLLHDLERRAARGHDGRRMGRREQERPGPLDQDVAQVLAAGDVAAEGADSLRQGPDLDGNPAVQPEVVDGAASIPPQHARRVGVVDEHGRPDLLGRLHDPGERGNVAVHAEHPIGHDEDQAVGLAGPVPTTRDRLPEHLPQGADVGVRHRPSEAPSKGACRR